MPRARPSSRRGNASVTRAADVRHQERAADALDEPGDDQQEGGRGDGAGHRRDREECEAEGVGPRPADLVGDPAGVEDEDRRGQRVADDDPHEREEVRVEVAQDLRQGDDQRPGGQRREQRADAGDAEDDPAIVVAGFANGVCAASVAARASGPS